MVQTEGGGDPYVFFIRNIHFKPELQNQILAEVNKGTVMYNCVYNRLVSKKTPQRCGEG